ncbi:MAG TPA: hypothetical protein VGR81_03930 [Candidatus Acidoferrales bacterium]|nr:hypothetical protein [Candidatus Acidoferrales bacterium]
MKIELTDHPEKTNPRGTEGKSANRFCRWLVWSVAALVLLFAGVSPSRAQDKPLSSIDLDCRAFAISVDGTVACAVFHKLHFQHYEIERDDIWTVTLNGKRKRIVDGETLVKTTTPFSFMIRRLAYSPDATKLTVQMTIAQVVDQQGTTNESELVDLMTDEGKEIPVFGTHTSVIEDGKQANWLADGDTVAYLVSSDESDLLYHIGIIHPSKGAGDIILKDHYFTSVAWDAQHNSAIAVERDQQFTGAIKLSRIDLLRGTDQPIATLQGYLGQLTLSPDADKVAYFRDGDTLEIRSLANPQIATTVHCAYGTIAWSPDERRILLKRGPEKNAGDIVWLSIPSGDLTPILHDNVYVRFAVSVSTHTVAVMQPGSNHVFVFPLQ